MIAYKEVGPVPPFFEKLLEVLEAQVVSFHLSQRIPLAMFMSDQRYAAVGDDAISSILDMEAKVQVQVTIKSKHLPHQAYLIDQAPPHRHAVGLHSISVARFDFIVEMVNIIGR